MISKLLTFWLRREHNQERLRLWLGAAGAVMISVLTIPAVAEAEDVRVVRADGALLDKPAPEGVAIVNRRSKIIFVDPFELSGGLAGGASERSLQRNLIRIGRSPRTKISVYRGGRLSPSRSTGRR